MAQILDGGKFDESKLHRQKFSLSMLGASVPVIVMARARVRSYLSRITSLMTKIPKYFQLRVPYTYKFSRDVIF